jgi:hypothetical protein
MISDCMIPVYGEWDVKVVRADGSVEKKTLRNIVTRAGLNRIAARAVTATGNTPAYVLAVGTQTAAHSLDSANIGEVTNGRKQFVATGAAAQSREWIFGVATWAGNADSLTGIALDSAAIADHLSSGQGAFWNAVNGLAVTLQASDFLNLTVRLRVGSHNLSHST